MRQLKRSSIPQLFFTALLFVIPCIGYGQSCSDSLIISQVFGSDTSYFSGIIDSIDLDGKVNAKNIILTSISTDDGKIFILDDEFRVFPNAASLEITGWNEVLFSAQISQLSNLKFMTVMAPTDLNKIPDSFANCKVEYLLIWGDPIVVTGIPDAILNNNNIQFLDLTLSNSSTKRLWRDLLKFSNMEGLNCLVLQDFGFSKRKGEKLKRHCKNYGIEVFL